MSAQGITEEALAEVSLGFQQAAIGARRWEDALAGLAHFTGSQCAELIGFGARRFHFYTGVYDGVLDEFDRAGGRNLAVNSRIRIGLNAAELTVLDESDFTTEADCRRHREYGAMIEKIDIPFVCLTSLQKRPENQLGLAVMRSRRVGNIERDQKRLFGAAAPHVLSAFNMALALEHRSFSLLRHALDTLEEAAFVIDASGRVQSWTPAADDLLSRGLLTLKDRRLGVSDGDEAGLAKAINAALRVAGVHDEAPRTILARDEQGLGFMIHVTPLPGLHGFDFDAAALVVAKPPKDVDLRAATLAKQLFGLTKAEAAVGGLLASGLSAQIIAERQHVSLGTVRTHIRRLLEKSGAASQTEFVAALARRF